MFNSSADWAIDRSFIVPAVIVKLVAVKNIAVHIKLSVTAKIMLTANN
jgi:hypothetical protein